jgi:hypothetical protein
MANDNDLDLSQDTIDDLVRIATDPSFDDGDFGVLGQGVQGLPPGGPVLQPQFQQGGAVGAVPQQSLPPQAAGVNPAGNNTPIPAQQLDVEAQRAISRAPEKFLQIKQIIEKAVANGEITMEELNLAGQLATAAAQNPQLWPQLRQFAIQKGLAEENELPQEYDQGLVFTLILAVKAIQGGGPQAQGQPPQAVGGAPQMQGQAPVAGLRQGGAVPNSRNRDGSVAITAHDGEFVIPERVVREKGTDFFEKLIEPKNAKTA